MELTLGIICALLSGAGVMYVYMEASGRLRNRGYELELLEQIRTLKLLEKAYLEDIRKRDDDNETENEKWTSQKSQVSPEKMQQAIQEGLSNLLKPDTKK